MATTKKTATKKPAGPKQLVRSGYDNVPGGVVIMYGGGFAVMIEGRRFDEDGPRQVSII